MHSRLHGWGGRLLRHELRDEGDGSPSPVKRRGTGRMETSEVSVQKKSAAPVGRQRERGEIRTVKDGARYGFIKAYTSLPWQKLDVFLDSKQMREPAAMAVGVAVEFTRVPSDHADRCDRAIDVTVWDGKEA